MNDEILHVYTQPQWHAAGHIAGNRDAIVALRDAANAALENGQAVASTFTSDGEGYDLIVTCLSTEDAEKLVMPYTEEYARDDREDDSVLRPWDFHPGEDDTDRA